MENIKQISNSKNDIKQEQTSSSEMNRSPRVKSSNRLQNKVQEEKKLIVIIRISGMVKVRKEIEDTLYRMRLRRKYSCVVVKPTKNILGMIEKVRYYVSYGEINKETYERLVKARGKKINGELKPFFRLHPPRGGLKNTKEPFPKGILGNNKEINELVERML